MAARYPSQNLPVFARCFALLGLFIATGCSTVMEGRTQKIEVVTAPAGASCVLHSNEEVIGVIASTPDTIDVRKSKYDIVVECSKEGYVMNRSRNHSDYAISGLGNFAFMQFSFVGSMVDNASGAGNKYDSQVFVELEKAPAVPQQMAQAAVPQVVQYVIAQPVQPQPVQEVAQLPAQPFPDIVPLPAEQSGEEITQ